MNTINGLLSGEFALRSNWIFVLDGFSQTCILCVIGTHFLLRRIFSRFLTLSPGIWWLLLHWVLQLCHVLSQPLTRFKGRNWQLSLNRGLILRRDVFILVLYFHLRFFRSVSNDMIDIWVGTTLDDNWAFLGGLFALIEIEFLAGKWRLLIGHVLRCLGHHNWCFAARIQFSESWIFVFRCLKDCRHPLESWSYSDIPIGAMQLFNLFGLLSLSQVGGWFTFVRLIGDVWIFLVWVLAHNGWIETTIIFWYDYIFWFVQDRIRLTGMFRHHARHN